MACTSQKSHQALQSHLDASGIQTNETPWRSHPNEGGHTLGDTDQQGCGSFLNCADVPNDSHGLCSFQSGYTGGELGDEGLLFLVGFD